MSPQNMVNRGTRLLRNVCESEEGGLKAFISYLISSKSNKYSSRSMLKNTSKVFINQDKETMITLFEISTEDNFIFYLG